MSRKFEDDLAGSGISPLTSSEFVKHGLVSPVSEQELRALFPQRDVRGAEGLSFTYYDLHGKPLDYKRYKVYWPPLTGFAAKATDPRPKYLQVAGSPNHLYTPPIIDWDAFLVSPETLLITEGEKKTLAAQLRGLPCVGLGGVDSFSNRKRGQSTLLELKALVKDRIVLVVFDIDNGHTSLKPEVAAAATRLCAHIIELGGRPMVTTLPSDGTRKMALDDWLLGPAKNLDLVELLVELHACSHDYDAAELLYAEAAKYVYINHSNAMGSIETREDVPVKDYRVSSGNRMLLMRQLTVDRTGLAAMRPAALDLATAFLRWPSRPTARGFTYAPGVEDYMHEGLFNQWKGWAQRVPATVTEDDVRPLRDCFMGLYNDDWREMWDWFMLPIARPGVKQVIVPVIQSEFEGVGKSSIPAFFAKFVYGEGPHTPDNASTMSTHALKQGRLEFAQRKQFLFIDDANDMHGQEIEALVKNLATTTSIRVDPKYVRSYNCPNTVNLCITTNRSMVFRLPDDDRRFFIPEVQRRVLPSTWDALHKWGAAGGGGKVIAYAQQLFDAERVDPYRRAPMTAEKELIMGLARSDLDNYIIHLADQAGLGKTNRVVVTMSEMRTMLVGDGVVDNLAQAQPWAIKKAVLTAKGMFYRGAVRVGDRTEAVYILANCAAWFKKAPCEVAKELLRCPVKGPYKAEKSVKADRVRKF